MIAPWPFQQNCVTRIRDALRRCRRVLLASPAGSGKTIMFVWLAMAVAGHGACILRLAHREEIAEQISAALAFAVPHGIITPGRAAITLTESTGSWRERGTPAAAGPRAVE